MCHCTFPNCHTVRGLRGLKKKAVPMYSAGLPRPAEGSCCPGSRPHFLSFTLEILLFFLCGQETGIPSLCCCRCHCYQSPWVSVDSPSPTPVSHEAGSDLKRTVSLVKLSTETFDTDAAETLSSPSSQGQRCPEEQTVPQASPRSPKALRLRCLVKHLHACLVFAGVKAVELSSILSAKKSRSPAHGVSAGSCRRSRSPSGGS